MVLLLSSVQGHRDPNTNGRRCRERDGGGWRSWRHSMMGQMEELCSFKNHIMADENTKKAAVCAKCQS